MALPFLFITGAGNFCKESLRETTFDRTYLIISQFLFIRAALTGLLTGDFNGSKTN
jgi:hypothetical protein